MSNGTLKITQDLINAIQAVRQEWDSAPDIPTEVLGAGVTPYQFWLESRVAELSTELYVGFFGAASLEGLDKYDLLRERAELVRHRKLHMQSYAKRHEAINEALRALKPPAPPSALERYTEPEDAPARACKGCGETLLRACRENARRVEAICARLVHRSGSSYRPVDDCFLWSHVKRMRTYEYCCAVCRTEGNGHSRYCISAVQEQERMEEFAEEERGNA